VCPTPATILVADDDDDLRFALSSLLSSEGYGVVELADGASTLEFLAEVADGKRACPDVLLLDFCMPGLSGIGLLQVLRRFGAMPPAILITAFRDPSVDTFAHNAGAVRVLRKPVEGRDVLTAIRSALVQASPPREKPQDG
jgi:CheY-like chemotaxis protein